jgi:DNA polymerase-1
MGEEAKKLIVVDGYSLLYRAFFGSRYLSTSDGRPTNALFGFTNMLFRLIEEQRPDCVVVALDAPGGTFRHEAYEGYKATRPETPNELAVQTREARRLIAALGIPSIELPGYEADDVVGTISREAEANGYRTFIVTGDLDSLQLVDEWVTVVTTRMGVTDVVHYTPAAVRERYGFGPEYVADYKALVGDKSDNIPGVPGIGDKSATLLIQRFGPVESIIERLPEVEDKFRKKIEPHVEQLKQSKWLATIQRNAPIAFDFEPYRLTAEQMEEARAMLESFEFRSAVRRIGQVLGPYVAGGGGRAAVQMIVEAEAIEASSLGEARSPDQVERWIGERTFAMLWQPAAPQGSMFDDASDGEAIFAVGRETMRWRGEASLRWLADRMGRAVLHDAKPLYRRMPATLVPPRFDATIAGYVLQSGRAAYALRDLVQGYLDVQAPDSPEQQAVALGLLESPMRERLAKESQSTVFEEIELPLVPILAEMERYGVLISTGFLGDFSVSLNKEIERTAAEIFRLAGEEFLIASPKQLGEVLFDKLKIPHGKKTKTGYATGAEVLQELALDYPICGQVLHWRELTKLKGTYADALPRLVGEDGRIHTTFNQTVAATGRLSSNDPNLQNIPIRTELGREIRRAFVAAPGFRLASFDYSQIELRLLAHLSHDDALVDAFQRRVDVHAVTAGLMFGLDPGDVSREQRRLAKMLNYAVLYGVTGFGLAQQLGEGFGVTEADALIKQYFERFPKVKAFTQRVVEDARAKGFTTTLIGRRRYFPEIHAANRMERLYAERQAINAPIQGAAADLAKIAMIRVRRLMGGASSRMLLQVHDELLFELADGEESLIEPIRQAMEGGLTIDVPIEVDAKVGPNWNDMAPVGLSASS